LYVPVTPPAKPDLPRENGFQANCHRSQPQKGNPRLTKRGHGKFVTAQDQQHP